MENINTRKSLVLWGSIFTLLLITIVIRYNSLPDDYWDPLEAHNRSIPETFKNCITLAKYLDLVQKDLFEAQKILITAANVTNLTSSIEEFNQATERFNCKIDTLKYAEIAS